MFSIQSWHKLIDIEGHHIFNIVAKGFAKIFRYLLNLTSFFNEVNINDSILRFEYVIIGFIENSFLDQFLLVEYFTLFFPGPINLKKLIKHKYDHLNSWVIRILKDQVLQISTDILFVLKDFLWFRNHLKNFHWI